MNTTDLLITPLKALNKAYRKQPVDRPDIERYKDNLNALLKGLDPNETEEHLKNNVITLLNDTWYKDEFAINTKGRTDLVIHNDKTTKSTAGVLLEVKRLGNREMVSKDNLNTKALQELVLYYLRERIEEENKDIKHLIITNAHEWFIFDGNVFYQCFYKNPKLLKAFKEWSAGQKDSAHTTMFFKDIAGPAIEEQKENLTFTWFDLNEVTGDLKKGNDSQKLISFYKVLSPVHLLNQPFTNDSNSLNKKFYHELLHIIGLEEVKEKGKKLIRRKEKDHRDDGSLLENAINIMEERDRHRVLNNPTHFGNTVDEQLYSVALELCITWINRILFLKLLESQLVTYHKGDKQYRFLDIGTIPNFDSLESLFFGVLAKKQEERNERYREKFAHVPYLNSSLFEPTGLEEVLTITMLNNNIGLKLYSQTVLKNDKGARQIGSKDTLSYLFEFLEAYDFSSEGKEEVQEEKKSLINASVLGLIFEKINGYKDGSFYTPGFITMYMCRETIRRSVVQKFNEAWGWRCKEFEDLKEDLVNEIRKSDKGRNKVRKEANEIINSLKICDPAVGSGHFLVSALNEIITIKSELHILTDRKGEVLSEYVVEIDNDELAISNLEAELFKYSPTDQESQRVQEALFHEKQTIIENCLFGVDINPNSVKICRLRLWIELLKNAYYKNETELETLPNIDINIKRGNSLISRFDLDTDISEALKKSKWDVTMYRNAVNGYKNATRKEDKREFERLIEDIKGDFETEISKKDKRVMTSQKLKGQLTALTTQTSMFDMTPAQQKKWKKEVETKTKILQKLEEEIDAIKSNKIYEDAFEWRFEFPEVLDDDGNFVGFDVVIGNPPYIRQEEVKQFSSYFQSTYKSFSGKSDIYVFFYEKGLSILKNCGELNFITSSKFFEASYGKPLIEFLLANCTFHEIINFNDLPVFEDATAYPVIVGGSKNYQSDFQFDYYNVLELPENTSEIKERVNKLKTAKSIFIENDSSFIDIETSQIIKKVRSSSQTLKEYVGLPIVGVKTGFNDGFLTEENDLELVRPYVFGRDIKKYSPIKPKKKVVFPYSDSFDLVDIVQYPKTHAELSNVKKELSQRAIIKDGLKTGTKKWYEYQQVNKSVRYDKEMIVYPNVSLGNNFTLSKNSVIDMTAFVIQSNSLYLLGILNSRLVEFLMKIWAIGRRGGYAEYKVQYMEKVPVAIPSNKLKNKMEDLVSQVLIGKQKGQNTAKSEKEIDQLVYELYGLTEEEIRIVEGKT
ncbi:MAG: Eco57I restriction-modification methylase domain-containing protein [Bacteroidota bacterium]